MPGFVWATLCIHLMDCQGRGSPPWETVEWREQTLKRKGIANTACAQVLERAGPREVLDNRTAAERLWKAIHGASRCSHRRAPAGPLPAGQRQLAGPGLRAPGFLPSTVAVAQFKFTKVLCSGLPLIQPCLGPLISCPVPGLRPGWTLRKRLRGRRQRAGREGGCWPVGWAGPPLQGKHSRLPKCPRSSVAAVLWAQERGWRGLGLSFGVFWDITDALGCRF